MFLSYFVHEFSILSIVNELTLHSTISNVLLYIYILFILLLEDCKSWRLDVGFWHPELLFATHLSL